MKFHHFPAFAKHLANSLPHHRSCLYLIISPCRFEGKKMSDYLIHAMQKDEPSLTPEYADATRVEASAIIEQLNTRPMLSPYSLIAYEGVDQMNKAGWQLLTMYGENPSPFGVLILLATSGKNLASFYQKAKKELVVLDLTEEKPWDRKIRIERYLVEMAQREGCRLSAQASAHLVDRLGLDISYLEQAVLKLICYVGERKEIEMADINTVCLSTQSATTWQIVESFVWEEKATPFPSILGIDELISLMGALRHQWQLGLQLAALLNQSVAVPDIRSQFPQLKPALLDKKIAVVKKRGAAYFRQGLDELFQCEMQLKNGSSSPALLLDILYAKCH